MENKMNEKKFDVLINEDAKTNETTFRGLSVKHAYYTAGYRDGSTERELGGVNHANTYVIAGKELGFPEIQDLDLLVRTGNGASSIKPEVRAIEDSTGVSYVEINERQNAITHGFYDGFRTRKLAPELERRVNEALGLTVAYERIAQMHASLGSRHPLLIAVGLLQLK